MRKSDEQKKIIGQTENGITRLYPESDKVLEKNRSVRKRSQKPIFSSRMLVVAVVAILLLVAFIADACAGGFVSTVNGKMVAAFTKNSTQEFCYNVDAENVYAFYSYDDGFLLLTDDGISYINSDGSLASRQQLTYSNPVLVKSDDRIMIFDRGKSSYSLMNGGSLYSQQSVNEDIIDAAVSSKNNYAVAVKDENAKCILYGFSSNGKLIYQWNCPDGYIADVAINESGSKVAVTVIDAVNAVLCSSVYILDFEYDSAYAQFDYADETVIGTKFITNRKIQVITDRNVYLITAKNQEIVYEYSSSDICYASMADGAYTAVVTKDYTHDDYYALAVFTKYGKLKYTTELSGKIIGLSSSGKSIAVLFDDKTETYSNTGKLVGTASDLHHYEDIVINGNYLYVLSSDSVKKYAAYGMAQAVYSYEDETL